MDMNINYPFFIPIIYHTLIGRPSLKFQWNPKRSRTEGIGQSLFLTLSLWREGNPDPIPNYSLYVTEYSIGSTN